MNKPVIDVAVAAAIIGVLVGAGIAIGFLIWGHQYDYVQETHATPIEMADGSRVLSREPDGKAQTPKPETPKGHKVVRTIETTVQGAGPVPKRPSQAIDCMSVESGQTVCQCYRLEDLECPPVTVRVDLLEAPDGTYRAQASTADGEILDGVDIPRAPIIKPVERRWAVGYEHDQNGRQGGFLSRDVGRVNLGVSVHSDGVTGRIGWKF